MAKNMELDFWFIQMAEAFMVNLWLASGMVLESIDQMTERLWLQIGVKTYSMVFVK